MLELKSGALPPVAIHPAVPNSEFPLVIRFKPPEDLPVHATPYV